MVMLLFNAFGQMREVSHGAFDLALGRFKLGVAHQGCGARQTAAGTAGTTSTGNATLGANNTAWTSSASGASNTFTATVGSTANLAAGCVVLLKGSTDDAEFGLRIHFALHPGSCYFVV